MKGPFRSLVVATAALCITAQPAFASPAGGTTIVNAASATYSDAANHQYSTSSEAVVATVAQLSALVVSPKEQSANTTTDLSAVNSTTIRTFTITNTSNISDAYQLDRLTAGTLTITHVSWMTTNGPVATAVNGSVSPTIAPGASLQVQVTISTAGMTIGTSVPVSLEAHTTATGTSNGVQTDAGQQWIVGTTGPSITGGGGPNTPIAKTVNQVSIVQSQPGNVVQFDIVARNSGGAPATNVRVSDPVPAGLAIDPTSATINGQPAGAQAAVNGQTIVFSIPVLAPGITDDFAFKATLPPGSTLGESFVNIASIEADGIPPLVTTPANVFAGSANIVYDGFAGSSHPVGGATVSLLDTSNKPVNLSAMQTGSRPANVALPAGINATQNPFLTGADGSYGFALPASAIPAGGARYYLTIAAPNYLNRRIAIDLVPAANANFYNVTQSSQDGQPLAIAGGFTLTKNNVNINDLFGLFGNLPLFMQGSLVVTKSVDKSAASPGDRLLFTIAYQNQTQTTFSSATVIDTMPAGLVYLPGTSRVDGVRQEPQIDGRTLTWTQGAIAPAEQHTITFAATIFASAAAGTTLTNTASAGGTAPGNIRLPPGTSSVTVTVLNGLFSSRRVVTGRVFVDDAHRGFFVRSDRVLPGVRVVMEDGTFVITDAHGMFNFPAVRPGLHALRVDPLTLPDTVRTTSSAPMNSNASLERVLHGVLDDGTMEDIQFAVEPK